MKRPTLKQQLAAALEENQRLEREIIDVYRLASALTKKLSDMRRRYEATA